MIGSIIGSYRVTERIGGGGISEVWKAVDLGLDRVVAIKSLRPELAVREPVVARFRSEAQTLARLSHPNIATLHTLLENQDSLFMVMEYVEGETLSSMIHAAGRFDLNTAFGIFEQVLDGIGHAHEVGVIHRDIKGSNLMVNSRGVVKIMDFGIARVMGSDRMTRHGNLVGTPEFMSPEQVRGEEATVESDIYALGLLLYEMLTGRVPFRMKGDFELMQAQVKMPPPPPRSLVPQIPEAIEEVMLRALEKKPESRYRTTDSFLAALRKAGASAGTTSRTGRRPGAAAGGRNEDPEDPTLMIDGSDSIAARPTQLIVDGEASDPPDRRGSPARNSHRWSRLAAGAALLGLTLGANFLSTHQRSLPEASGGAAPDAAVAEAAAQATGDRAGESGVKSPRGAASTPPLAAPKPAPPRGAGGGSQVAPKKDRRSSEEKPGWVIRRE
jgi:serine/threonine-protein kinase